MNIFFTSFDSSITGTSQRDPLGFQPVWSYYGRKIVKHITTISDQIYGFREILLCLSICEECNPDGVTKDDILLFEQLCVYSLIEHLEKENGNIEGILGGDNGLKKFKQENEDPLISTKRDETILANEISLGYFGRYKTPFTSMGLLLPNGRINHHVVSQKDIEKFFEADNYQKIKQAFQNFKKGKNHHFRRFPKTEREMLYKAVMGEFRQDEKAFWLDRFFSIKDNDKEIKCILMEEAYNQIEIKNNAETETFIPKKIFEFLKKNNDSSEAKDILILESFFLCLEQVFYKAANSENLDSLQIENLAEHERLYKEFKKCFFNRKYGKETTVASRMKGILDCDPTKENYVKKILDYHKFVCGQKKSQIWIEVQSITGKINRYMNVSDVKIDLDTWNRTYYLSSLREIKRGLEK